MEINVWKWITPRTGIFSPAHQINGSLLYYRGRRVRDAVIADLINNRGLSRAEEVIVAGTSAGGLAVILHLDAWRRALPANIKLRGLADSGFFAEQPSFSGDNIYPAQMKELAVEQNSTQALSKDCVSSVKYRQEPWRCFFAPSAIAYVTTPLFVLQTRFDSWQMAHVFKGNGSVAEYEKEGEALESSLQSVMAAKQQALFLEACRAHGLSITAYWDRVAINGTAAHSAFSQWYFNAVPLGANWIDCKEVECNPLCS